MALKTNRMTTIRRLFYRYHYWHFQCQRCIFVPFLLLESVILRALFPKKKDILNEQIRTFLNPKEYINSLPAFSSSYAGRYVNEWTIDIVIIGSGAFFVVKSFYFAILPPLFFFVDYLFFKKNGFSLVYGTEYKQYFLKYMEESLFKKTIWLFAFSVFTLSVIVSMYKLFLHCLYSL